MQLNRRQLITLLPMGGLAAVLSGCGGGASSTGGGAATGATLGKEEAGLGSSQATAVAPAPGSAPGPVAANRSSDDFHLVFEQSYQSCSSCGIWFDSAELVITHSEGRFTASQSGSLLIKQSPYRVGTFRANLSPIPRSAVIENATLFMHLNRKEGISNDDNTSTVSVYGFVGGGRQYLREITAREDIKGRGFSKANPVVPFDFTNYAKLI